jgi:hypothetical protein|tara:strand:+ start:1092 stop:1718 length:627 start_codon:yes stop_codon:yes gene_type:complete
MQIIKWLKEITEVLKSRSHLFPKKYVYDFSKNLENDLEKFIKEKSAYVTQVTLFGYLKTRMGTRHTLFFSDKKFNESIKHASWNIYIVSLTDFILYAFSYLDKAQVLKRENAKQVFISILKKDKEIGLSSEVFEKGLSIFSEKLAKIRWETYCNEDPFKDSALALYEWAPVAIELKKLDKKIVLNSMHLKWNLVQNEFIDLVKKANLI